ncbi:protein Njmu-R1 isoform X2 [Lingula anatina]|uniref:Protein Njmu-R1 isoform X2 n=1 Tax=Lingula anatina TaxID=7574 RepID=A0A1S3H4X3_LINAN|nr:protein Njmu-R1 isoform X2 [Lingula anatina]|eukprot:XP_013380184.1 protein Njmu-R1 isoform X2 [Lingula anatina]
MAELPTAVTDNTPRTFYALYTYHTNRLNSVTERQSNSVSDFLQKEAKVNEDFSLSVISCSLDTEKETDLRKFIAKKLARGTVYSGSGNVTAVDFPLIEDSSTPLECYYCLIRQGVDLETVDQTPPEEGFYCRECVVCFISPADGSLDLFRPELDKFSDSLLPLLEEQLTDVNQQLSKYLETWQDTAINYVCRCVQCLGQDIQYLIYAALMNNVVEFQGDQEPLKTDLKKFIESCSLSDLLSSSGGDGKGSDSGSNQSAVLVDIIPGGQWLPQVLTVTVQNDACEIQTKTSTKFCEEWAKTLTNGEQKSAVFLKHVMDSFKLKAIQDMNSLKRLIQQAENDHYALYRAYVFLKNCGNGRILLHHASVEDHTVTSPETRDVLVALQEFINESGGLELLQT